MLSIFPGLLGLVSILSLVEQGTAIFTVLDQVQCIVPPDAWKSIRPALENVLSPPAPGIGLLIGLLAALWSASGYVKAFGRAMNILHDIREGRGFIKFNL